MVAWDVDARPMSLYTRAYVLGMRVLRDKRAFEGSRHAVHVARERQQDGNRGPTRWLRITRSVTVRTDEHMTVWTVRPRRDTAIARVLYVHGGGYLHPLTVDYWRLVRSLSGAAEVVVPAYPLAPDATVDDVLPLLVDLAVGTEVGRPSLPTILMGDSAGGALVLAVAQTLRDAPTTGARPAAVVVLSPWLDATLSDPAVAELEPTDPMLAESGLRAAGRLWAGERRPEDPLVSPVTARLRGLPPIDVFIGDRDILRPAVERFAQRGGTQGADIHVHERTAMFHVWMTRAIPEARRTRAELVRLLRRRAEEFGSGPPRRAGSG